LSASDKITVLYVVNGACEQEKQKADEGATGLLKVKSQFVNLWKSGNVGRGAFIGAVIVFAFATLFIVSTVTGKDRVQEIFELAKKSAKEDHSINFGGFFVGMSRHDLSALREEAKRELKRRLEEDSEW